MEEYLFTTYAKQGSTLPCFCYKTVLSTNLTAKEKIRAGDAPQRFAVLSCEQTGGRGRYGRSFLSLADRGAFVTYARRISDGEDITPLGGLCALAACDLLAESFGLDCLVKWPNDVLADGGKICGILPETVYAPDGCRYLLLGTGVNLFYTRDELGNLADVATSAVLACKSDEINARYAQDKQKSIFGLGARLAALDDALCDEYGRNGKAVRDRYEARLSTVGKEVSFTDEKGVNRKGKATGVNGECALAVECSDGVTRYVGWGEVTVQK